MFNLSANFKAKSKIIHNTSHHEQVITTTKVHVSNFGGSMLKYGQKDGRAGQAKLVFHQETHFTIASFHTIGVIGTTTYTPSLAFLDANSVLKVVTNLLIKL